MPTTTHAATADDYGEVPGVLSVRPRHLPDPAAGEVRVDVAFASVNPVDWKLLVGGERKLFDVEFPFHAGCDGAGTIAAVGAGVTDFAVGDRVAFNSPVPRCGAMAGAVNVPAETCAKVPAEVDTALAAALPVVAETAHQALFDSGKLQAGQTVLIHGASGAVGCCGVQLAKRAGAAVIGTASGRNADYVRLLGVDTFIDYRTERFEDRVKEMSPDGVDLVLDTAGGETTDRSFAVLKSGGHLASVADRPDPEKAKAAGVTAEMVVMKPSGSRLASLLGLAAKGRLAVEIAEARPLSEAPAMLAKQKGGGFRGKLLLDRGSA